MSANVSFIRAAASCTPFVGPFMGLYNVLENRMEIDRIQGNGGPLGKLRNNLQELRVGLVGLQGAFSALAGSREGIDRAKQQLEEMQKEEARKYQRLLPVLERKSFYSKCGIAASVLTVAAIVSLFALGILTGVGAVMMGAAFSLHIGVHALNLYRTHKDVQYIHTYLLQHPVAPASSEEPART